MPYHRYAGYLKFLTWTLFVYVATAFTVACALGRSAALDAVCPSLSLDRDLLADGRRHVRHDDQPLSVLLAGLAGGRGIASEPSRADIARGDQRASDAFRQISLDTWIGMVVSNLIAFFIIVTTAATLARMASPISRPPRRPPRRCGRSPASSTFALFAAGIIGTGLLAVPMLAGSAAYAVAETFGLRGSLELPASRALGFYAIVGAATLGGAALAATNIDPIAMLFWTAVLNGVVSVPIMAAMMLTVSGKMRDTALALPRWL